MPESAPANPSPIAFFDVDNTLVRGASLYYFGRGAFRRGYVGLRDIMMFAWQQARFLAVGENKQHLAIVKERALELLSGHTQQELHELAQQIVDHDIAPRVVPETLGWAREHLEQGHEVWLATATPFEVAGLLSSHLGFHGALATRLVCIDGIYTGELDGHVMHGDRKVAAVRKLTESHGVDLNDCWAYSDSRNDIPLLNLVGHPVAVNPDRALERYATAKGWPIRHIDKHKLSREQKQRAKAMKKAQAGVDKAAKTRVQQVKEAKAEQVRAARADAKAAIAAAKAEERAKRSS